MKIEKVKSREYKGKQYFKYRISIPENKMKEADLKEGDELDVKAKNGELNLKKIN